MVNQDRSGLCVTGLILRGKILISEVGESDKQDIIDKYGLTDKQRDFLFQEAVTVTLLPLEIGDWWKQKQIFAAHEAFLTESDGWLTFVRNERAGLPVPEWFKDDRSRYLRDFQILAMEAIKKITVTDEIIERIDTGTWCLINCTVREITGDAVVYMYNTKVATVSEKAFIDTMSGNSSIQVITDTATVGCMTDKSFIDEMHMASCVLRMIKMSTIDRVTDNARIRNMQDDSTINTVSGSANVYGMADGARINTVESYARVSHMGGVTIIDELTQTASVRFAGGSARINLMNAASVVDILTDNASIFKMEGHSTVISREKGSDIYHIINNAVAINRVYGGEITSISRVGDGSQQQTNEE